MVRLLRAPSDYLGFLGRTPNLVSMIHASAEGVLCFKYVLERAGGGTSVFKTVRRLAVLQLHISGVRECEAERFSQRDYG